MGKGYTGDYQLAQIYREQWDDYVRRFFPLEDELAATYQNPEVHGRILAEAEQRTLQAADVAQGSYQRTLGRFGMNPDAQVRQEAERSAGLSRTLAQVDTRNRTRQALIERDQGMLAGGMSTGGVRKEDVQ